MLALLSATRPTARPRRSSARRRALVVAALFAAFAAAPRTTAVAADTALRSTARGSPRLPPVLQPSVAHHLTILKIGDSLGEELGFGLTDVLGHDRFVTVVQDAVGDTGLARPDYYNWPQHLATELSQLHPRVVVVLLGGDDGQNFNANGGVVVFGSPAWHAIYSARVAALMSEATAAGAHVVWVGLPVMSSVSFSAEMAAMNAIYAAQAASHPGVLFVATWKLFADASGRYAASLPGPNGQAVLMRNPDGVHFSGAGDDRLATAVVAAMERAWHVRL